MYTLRVRVGQYIQDELFKLKDDDIKLRLERSGLDMPRGLNYAEKYDREFAISFLKANGRGIERQYSTGQKFESENDLSKRWPEKFERAAEVIDFDDRFRKRPDESIEQFAARMTALAEAERVHPKAPPEDEGLKTSINSPSVEAEFQTMSAGLDKMTVQELMEFAAQEEIDIQGFSRKSDLIRVIRDAKRLQTA